MPAGRSTSARRRRILRQLARSLPGWAKRPFGHIWWRYLRIWPTPLWRLRGYGDVDVAGHRLRLVVPDWTHELWAFELLQGRYEPEAIGFFTSAVHRGDVVLDIGAFSGLYTILAAQLVGPEGQVIAFEPDPVARRHLSRNVSLNKLSNVTGDAVTKVVQSPGARAVQTVTLRSFCDRRSIGPTVIKVDVEGGEHRVFNASSEPLVRTARVLVVEIHEEALAADGVTSHALCEQLRGWGKEPITLGATAHGTTQVGWLTR